MAKRTYKSYRGKRVDMEELRRKHEQTVAAGNMGVNAKGDKLGPGGQIIETTQNRARKHYKSTSSSSTKMSVKGDQDAKAQEEVFDREIPSEKSESKVRQTSNKTRKTSNKKKKETITEEGDIILEDIEEDEGDQ
jgi:hypothetical protein